ncbi:hypothetical protein XENTR_v10014014 [Xenopus tropicalis]|nr:hypothetical protein XENTR_v10014014 [Xenopus tropicalis]
MFQYPMRQIYQRFYACSTSAAKEVQTGLTYRGLPSIFCSYLFFLDLSKVLKYQYCNKPPYVCRHFQESHLPYVLHVTFVCDYFKDSDTLLICKEY